MKCDKCGFIIDERHDKWVRITDFDSGTEGRTINVHIECWRNKEKIAIQKAFNEKAKKIFPMLKNMFGGKNEENIIAT